MFALRQGHWKLIEGQTAGASVREKTSPDLPPGQLYNISTDPGEKNNLYTNHPEIVERLTGLLNKHRKSGRSTVAIP